MTKLNEIYKCNVCGNIVEILHEGVGQLVCCNQPMELQKEKTKDPKLGEKHVPVIEKTKTGIKVKIGAKPHPMDDEHYIEWIQVFAGGETHKKFLSPGEKAEVEFAVKEAHEVEARAFCNLHGLWKKG
ncbi:desulfoferrodoxin [Candidatus Woesearchaeota archaeon]|nr:desulfoferrodoxin [Candidatus Woesearchaeota archaeon]MBW3018328.1 desulfoferrodoxin [Candidatus Woesearchaeota archaeon]